MPAIQRQLVRSQQSSILVRKIVSGDDADTLAQVAALYEQVVTVGVHRASSIKVAEAAKAIENTQRDLNIARPDTGAGVVRFVCACARPGR